MKRKFTKLGLASVLAATVMGAIITTNNKNASQVNADAYNEKVSVINGLFEKVTDLDSIQDEEELLVLADGRYTFQFFVGASYHYWMTTEFSEFTDVFNNGSVVYANNVKGELVTFDKNDDGTYYLKLKHFVDYAFERGSIKSGYIVHEAYDNSGVTSFGDLFFREGKNKPNANQAKWNLTKEDGHPTLRTVSGRQLQYKQCGGYSWSSFIATPHTEWSSNIELYRKVKDPFGSFITVNQYPKTTYDLTDEADLSGLKITVELPSHQTFSVYYNDKPHLFSNIEFLPYYKAVLYDICGIKGYIGVTLNDGLQNEHFYLKSDAKIVDPRGTYLLGVMGGLNELHFNNPYENLPYTFILNLLTRNIDPGHSTSYYFGEVVPILSTNRSSTNPVSDLRLVTAGLSYTYEDNPVVVENRVEIVLEDGYYYLKGVPQNNYLYTNASGTLTSGLSGNPGVNNSITIDNNNHVLTHNGADIFVVDTTDDLNKVKTVSKALLPNANYRPLELFKLQFTSNLESATDAIDDFKDLFYEKTANYKSSVSSENWAALKTAFNNLQFNLQNYPVVDSHGYLASIQYNHNHEEEQSFGEMIDIYDYIVFTNDGNLEDFMGRSASGSLYNYRNVTLNADNCSINGSPKAYHNSNYVANLYVDVATTHFPETIEVLMGNQTLRRGIDYTYTHNESLGTITIIAGVITEDIVINASATPFAYHVTYTSSTSPTYFNDTADIDPGTYTLKTYAETGFPAHPEGKQFKCWLADAEEVLPNTTITLTGDIVITAVFEDIDAVKELDYRETVSSLSYNYEAISEGEFEISNVALRLGGLISKSSWDQLGTTFGGVQGFGVLICTSELEELVPLTPENATFDSYVPVATMEHPNLASNSVKTANHIVGEDFLKDYYAWNLCVNVGAANYTSDITAVAYVKTGSGYMYFGQITTSVKKQAEEMLENRGFEDAFDGSLAYLAGL